MIKRIYFLTSEIVPFAESYHLASFSKEIPIVFNERKYDFRLMMPKYSFISERRYILREVIRLRDMNLQYQNETIQASVKSAFIPNTKVQVYFLEHDGYYSNNAPDLYKESNSEFGHNALRFGYFASAALITLNYLRWKPEVIILNDWQMSLIPLMIKSGLLDNTYFNDVKILQILHSKNPLSNYLLDDYKRIGLTDLDSDLIVKNKKMDCVAAANKLSDHTLLINTGKDLEKSYMADSVYKNLFGKDKSKVSTYNLKSESPEEWQNLADEIIKIVEQL
ncbi:glycogen/starch synthase [bacterium]|nr:glycogen/starch synthase [bacterium]MBU1064057.1 glycogen/starch synthase [bacterium]MBU1634823.1 glycogen/starch synthase [bacterium]MBU1874688.1 glycogen/starch synthase [bacterium]